MELTLNPDGTVKDQKLIGYEWVDMGLSVKWATCNVGANTPEEYGDYYAWGETETKSNYSWPSYKFGTCNTGPFTKYNTNDYFGRVDNKTQLNPADDVAHVKWGGSWRIPTDAEWTELRNRCTWTWTTQGGVNGYKVTSKLNGNSIFLPAAGGRGETGLGIEGSYGNYWSSSLNGDASSLAWRGVYFNSDGVNRCCLYRCNGLSVRPVTD